MQTLSKSQQPTPLPRPDSPQRWQASAKRAAAEGITVRQLAGSGAWVATSGSDTSTAYEVTPWSCECQAGQHDDPICKHRAALRVRLGWLTVEPDPEPEPPAAMAVMVRTAEVPCHNCQGYGWGYGSTASGLMDRVTCWTCGGSGVEPVLTAA